MAVYSKLLLSAGGGIISASQQADQAKNTATVLIGLGGTGIDALRTIKTQVYSRLKPDDPDAVVPGYEHIRFLGIDTAKTGGDEEEDDDAPKQDALRALDDTELFYIGNSNVKSIFEHPISLQHRDELNWLRWRDIDAPSLSGAGAGGIRQVGRFMMMDKSTAFMSRLESEINAAKSGLASPTVNIHILAGISGGTGSGCFLDVCYMVRHVASKLGNATVFGYCFLPDVNLSRIPMAATKVREYIPRNGYAAMQELDYCMGLPANGGSFAQQYQGFTTIKWKEPPVDMCHLVCATNSSGDVIPKGYDYAMNVTAEYVMDFLTHSVGFGLDQHFANFNAQVAAANGTKTIGSHLGYCVIGASCASIPLREINTYLASELFEKFSQIGENMPGKADVERLAVAALARDARSITDIYDSLSMELREGFDDSYTPYTDDWKFVRDYGNSDLVTCYTNQTASKLNLAEKNAKSMADAKNKASLIGRLQEELGKIIRDINCGPVFAYRLTAAAQSHNMLNIIDGLLAENDSRMSQEAAQTQRMDDYNRAKDDFDNARSRGLFDSHAKRFGDYEFYLMLLEQHKLYMACYRKMEEILKTFRKQLEEATATYYIKFSRVISNLIATFKENRDALASEKILADTSSFSIPMMTIAELKKTLDEEIEQINVPGMLDQFMRLLQNSSEIWLTEDEGKIAKLVNTFFVETAFGDFANRTITEFLKAKYGLTADDQLANKIYNEWMRKLTAKAKPLFYMNHGIWTPEKTSELAFVSFPSASAPIKAAAAQMSKTEGKWQPKDSALTDRIFVMCSGCALPLSSYNNCRQYEHSYFSVAPEAGRHYYEGKPIPGMSFNDWRKLASLTPCSCLHLEEASQPMQEIMGAAIDLYENAAQANIFDDENRICQPSPAGLAALQALTQEAEALTAKLSKPSEVAQAEALLQKLEAAKAIPMVPTEHAMPNDGYAGELAKKLLVQKDHFILSPAYHIVVRDILNGMQGTTQAADAAIAALKAKIEKVTVEGRAVNDFCNGLFTGIIEFQGKMITYTHDEYSHPVVLTQFGEEFPFAAIPVYQAFLNYQTKLTAEHKEAIRKTANKMINYGDEKIKPSAEKFKAIVGGNQIKGWRLQAANFAEEADIIDFIKKFVQLFENFCLANDI